MFNVKQLRKMKLIKIPIIIVILLFSIFFVSFAYSDDSREIINNYFSKTCDSIGPELPDLNELRQIIKSGVNLNFKGQRGAPSALYLLENVAYKAEEVPKDQVDQHMKALLDILVEGGLVVKDNCGHNEYPAIYYNMYNYLDALMQYGCDLSQINIGTTDNPKLVNSIDLADKWGHDDLVKIFIKHGSKTQPEKVRVQLKLVGGAQTLNKIQIIYAVNKGAVINMPDMFGKTALQELLDSNDVLTKEGVDILKLLLDLRADPNLRYKSGDYPLYAFIKDKAFYCCKLSVGCKGYDVQVMNILIKSGALVSSKSGFIKRTPLHVAAEKNYYDAVRVLVENGAKVMVLDEIGKTPLDLTESGRIIKLLKDYGAIERGY